MGELIRKGASVEDIAADARATTLAADARGGRWSEMAASFLADTLALFDDVRRQQADADAAARPLQAAVRARDDEADDTVNAVYDEAWNLAGRSASDPVLAVLFPGGASGYVDGETAEQPDRMDLLAELLERGLHPRIPAAQAADMAARVRATSAALRAALDAARVPLARAEHLGRMKVAVGRVLHTQLSRLKRAWKAEGYSEAEIHDVIPDRPAPRPGAPRIDSDIPDDID